MSERDEFGGYTEREAMEIMGMPVPAPTPLQSRPVIPVEAVEAAAEAYRREFPYDENEGYVVKLILEAAAPHIRARALEDAANSRETERLFVFGWEARERLRTRAAAERGVE